MDSGRKKHQVVFLIDTSLATCIKCDHCNEVLLTVFRLLSLLEESCRKATIKPSLENVHTRAADKHRQAKNAELNFKWGFKFFNTVTTIPRNKLDNPKFRSFQLPQIDDFEKKVKDVFASVNEDKMKRKSLSHPSELLSTALTEVLHDFSWDESDIFSSPVTRRYVPQKLEQGGGKNLVFLLARAPCSRKSLRQFSNKMVIDSDVFIDSFMSPTLLNEYKQKLKLSLHWVDLSSSSCGASGLAQMSEVTPEAVAILRDTCIKLGGHFLLKDSIFSHTVSRGAATATDESLSNPLQLLSVFPEESRLTINTNFVKAHDGLCRDETITACLSFDGVQDMEIHMHSVKTLEKQRCLKAKTAFGGSKESEHQYFNGATFLDLNEAQFTLLGYVPHAEVCDKAMTPSLHSYLLDCKSPEPQMSSFLHHLAMSETLGVFCLKLKNGPHRTLAVLQSHPGYLGFITILSVSGTWEVEKTLWKQNDANTRETNDGHFDSIKSEDEKSGFMEKLRRDMEELKNLDKKSQVYLKSVEQQNMFQPHCMNSWHIPGVSSSVGALLNKIEARLEDSVPKPERDILKELQKFYCKEKQPKEVVQNLQPSTSTPMCALKNVKTETSGGSESGSRSSPRRHSRPMSSSLSRGRLMVDRARSASFVVAEDGNSSHSSRAETPMRRSSSSFGILDLDLNSEDDLKSYLLKQYEQVQSAGIAMETTIRTMVTVTSRFMANKQLSNPQKSAVNFIQKHLVVTATALKEKYNAQGSAEDLKNKIAEYKMQVTLLLEIESLVWEHDLGRQEKLVNELVSMLRALSFLVGATGLQVFLADVIVSSYSSCIPKLLVDVYDELMLPLPPALAKFASPSAPSSVWAPPSITNDSSLLSAPGSSQPASEQSSQREKRSRKLQQHPSISDFRQKRQILVKAQPKPKTEPKKTAKDKTKEKAKTRVRSSKTRYGVDCGSAKRNLFSNKPSSGGKQKETPSKRRTKKHRHRHHSGSEKSKTLVIGTPAHKQTSQRHLQRQQRRRQHDHIEPEVQVIAESPVKDDEVLPTSQLNKPARYLVREAFYSSNSQPSRNLARSLEQAQKGQADPNLFPKYKSQTSKQGTLSSAVRGESPMLSPRSRLIKSFMSSPSPTPKSKERERNSTSGSVRRSPRKSVKRLDFKASKRQSSISPSKANPHLIFDGENANDFRLLRSPVKLAGTSALTEGYKTPEKQRIPKPQMFETASCPPVLATPPKILQNDSSPELSFRNILSQGDNKTIAHGTPALTKSKPRGSQTTGESPVRGRSSSFEKRTPDKLSHVPQMFSSPDQATRLRASLFSKSPKKAMGPTPSSSKTPTKPGSSKTNIDSTVQTRHLRKERNPGREPVSTPTKGNKSQQETSDSRFSTPRKLFSPEKFDLSQHIHLTPSKVKFDAHLISPPSGCGYPPSAEKSTPGRSILKNSPSIKGKVVRRVELQSIADASPSSQSNFGSTFKLSERPRSPRKPAQHVGFQKQASLSVGNNMQENDCKVESDSTVKYKMEAMEMQGSSKSNNCLSEKPVSAEISVPLKQTTAVPKSNSKLSESRKRQRDEVDSSSSEDISDEECHRDADAPAAITIRTPSPSAKTKIDSIDKWARRKRSSSKNGSSSSSNSVLSPTSSSSSNEEKVKTPSRADVHQMGKENSSKNAPDESGKSPGKGKRIRKRSLFTVDESAATSSPSKRIKSLSEKKREQHMVCNASLDRVDTDIFEQGHSPDLIPYDGEDVFPSSSGISVFDLSTQNESNFSLSSQDTTNVSPSPSQGRSLVNQNFSSQHESSLTCLPLERRLTRQNSGFLEEGSQGFQTQVPSSSRPPSLRETQNSFSHQPSPSKSNSAHSLNLEMHSKITSKHNSNDQSNSSKRATKYNSIILTEDSNNKNIPPSLAQQSSLTKKVSSASSNSGGSPGHSESRSPEKQQYSPSLSATGLMHLIKSPLLSPRSRRKESQDNNDEKRATRSKSRKHLDLV